MKGIEESKNEFLPKKEEGSGFINFNEIIEPNYSDAPNDLKFSQNYQIDLKDNFVNTTESLLKPSVEDRNNLNENLNLVDKVVQKSSTNEIQVETNLTNTK